ncbi:MAG: group II intron reverse transcriptase/maturase [Algicola sp.]|nr:group II intron reverse transcriptase/maturase [Algicola sp.]
MNKTGNSVAELMEERTLIERNIQQNIESQTQRWSPLKFGLLGVREAARKDKKQQFTSLFHHITPTLLRDSFYELKKNAAAGIDGVSWQDYEARIDSNIYDLHERLHAKKYQPKPAKRITIPKSDGSERPISIQSVEDKIVQQAVVHVLNAIYENDFLGFSYGFRPERSQHNALDALYVGINQRKVNWILDMDLEKFFDRVEHDWLIHFIEHRVADQRLIKLVIQWITAGHMDEHGHRVKANRGCPQGSVISPLLANIYLHYVMDCWTEGRRRENHADMIIVRYADDTVLGFQYEEQARHYYEQLQLQLGQYGLSVNVKKTRLIEFGRYAAQNRAKRNLGKPETFSFLGFTHYCSQTRAGRFQIGRKTISKSINKKLKEIDVELRKRMHRPVWETAQWLKSVVRGHINYFGVPGNFCAMAKFRDEVIKRWLKALRRRSQRHKMPWSKFTRLVAIWIPLAQIVHPYPNRRFHVNTRSRSRMH